MGDWVRDNSNLESRISIPRKDANSFVLERIKVKDGRMGSRE